MLLPLSWDRVPYLFTLIVYQKTGSLSTLFVHFLHIFLLFLRVHGCACAWVRGCDYFHKCCSMRHSGLRCACERLHFCEQFLREYSYCGKSLRDSRQRSSEGSARGTYLCPYALMYIVCLYSWGVYFGKKFISDDENDIVWTLLSLNRF